MANEHNQKHQAWRNQSPPPNIDYIKETLGLDPKSDIDKTFIRQLENYARLPEKDKENLFNELSDRFDRKAAEYDAIQQLAKVEDGQTDKIIKKIEEIIENEADPIKKQALQQLLNQTIIANEYNKKVEENINEIENDERWEPTEPSVKEFETKINKHLTKVSEDLAKCDLKLPLEPSTKNRSGEGLTKTKFIIEMREELSDNFTTIKEKIYDFFSQKIETFYNKIFKTGDQQAAKETFMSKAFEAPKPGKGCDPKSPPPSPRN